MTDLLGRLSNALAADQIAGRDTQLERAVAEALPLLQENPVPLKGQPPAPDRVHPPQP